MKHKSVVLWVFCATLLVAFFMSPASSQSVKPEAGDKTQLVSSDPEREHTDFVQCERGLALEHEFLVQYLMEARVDPEQVDKVRLMLLESRKDRRELIAKSSSKKPEDGPDWLRTKAGEAAEGLKRKLRTVLTAKELDLMEKRRNDARLEAVVFLGRSDKKPGS